MLREILGDLHKWKDRSSRLPLIIRGARQVGKTYLIEEFAKKEFTNYLTINFEQQPEYKEIFIHSLDPYLIKQNIELISGVNLTAGESLLFLDEIQECKEAIQALRYFKEQMPDMHVIGAGSLLEFVLNDADFRMPVGRVEFLYIKPMTFHEFLLATSNQKLVNFLLQVTLQDVFPIKIHQQLLALFYQYLAIGGMPQVVDAYVNSQDLPRCSQLQAALLQTYQNDFGKYATKTQYRHLKEIFYNLPSITAKPYKYVDIHRELRAEDIKNALQLLNFAGIISHVFSTNVSSLPLSNYTLAKKSKLLFLDTALMAHAQYLPLNALMQKQAADFGHLVEHIVGQELLAIQATYEMPRLHYWYRDKVGSQAEVDYVISLAGKIIPIEVKSGHSYWLKSLRILMKERDLALGVRISEQQLSYTDCILSAPLYMIHELPRLINLIF